MRRTLPFLALLLAAIPLHAQDIFIRPPSSGSTTPSTAKPADLGIRARPATPPQQPAIQPPPDVTTQPQIAAPTAQPVPASTPQQQPSYQEPATPEPQYTYDSNAQIQTTHLATGADVITISNTPEPMPKGSGSNSLSISLQPGAVGTDDKNMVARMLGLNDQEILSNCYFEYQVISSYSDGNGDILPIGTAQSASIRFPTNLDTVDFYPTIACRKLRQPISGMVIDQGGYYKVSVSDASCPAGGRTGAVSLRFRYLGNGKGECVYQ